MECTWGFSEASTSVANHTSGSFRVCCREVTSNSLFLKALKTETTGTVLHSGKLKNFLQNQQMGPNALPFSLHLPNK